MASLAAPVAGGPSTELPPSSGTTLLDPAAEAAAAAADGDDGDDDVVVVGAGDAESAEAGALKSRSWYSCLASSSWMLWRCRRVSRGCGRTEGQGLPEGHTRKRLVRLRVNARIPK